MSRIHQAVSEKALLGETLLNLSEAVTLLRKYMKVRTKDYTSTIIPSEDKVKINKKKLKEVDNIVRMKLFAKREKLLKNLDYVIKPYKGQNERFGIYTRYLKKGKKKIRLNGFLLDSGKLHVMYHKKLVLCGTVKKFHRLVEKQN